MTNRTRSLLIAGIHLVIVASLSGKLIVDRATLPRGWARVVAYDPELPIRGRYVRLTLIVPPLDSAVADSLRTTAWPRLMVVDDRVRTGVGVSDINQAVYTMARMGDSLLVLRDPVAFFIPEKIPDPSFRPAGEQLWAEVTIPRRGPPRPIRLGLSKGDGPITPLTLSAE